MKKFLVSLFAILVSSGAFAQEALVKTPETPKEEWKANAGMSGIFNTGNSVSQTLGGSALISVKMDKNQVTWTGNGAYGRARDNATGITSTNTENWMTQTRYDRFLTETFSFYGLGHANHDAPAGFDFNYGGSAGFAHFLYKTDATTFKYELGFDVTRQRFVTSVEQTLYSGRGYLQFTHKFSENAFITQDMENLVNVNDTEDYRINALTALNFKLTEKFTFQAGYAIRFDNVPVPGFEKVDTTTQLGINVNFL